MPLQLTIVNFSHPLTETALNQISEATQATIAVTNIPVAVNTNESLPPQVGPLIEAALDADLIILPGLATVAALIARALPSKRIIVLKGVKSVAGVTFEFAEIV